MEDSNSLYSFSTDWFNTEVKRVWSALTDPIKENKIQVLEIGCFEGQSTTWILDNLIKNHSESILYCVDPYIGDDPTSPNQGEETYKRFLRNVTRSYSSQMKHYREKSETALTRFLKEGIKFDLIYVDGSHLYSDVLFDLHMSSLLLKEGGFLIVDDYAYFPEVRLATDNFLKELDGRHWRIYAHHQQMYLVKESCPNRHPDIWNIWYG